MMVRAAVTGACTLIVAGGISLVIPADAARLRARRLLEQGRADAAAAVLLRARAAAPISTRLLLETGEALRVCGQHSAAMVRYVEAAVQALAPGGDASVAELAARRLAATADQLPLFGPVDRLLAALPRLPLDRLTPARLRLRLLRRLALHQLRRNDLDQADRLLALAGEAPATLYLRGVIALARDDRPGARLRFSAAETRARAAASRRPSRADRDRLMTLADLAALARARLATSPALARQHYLRVDPGSPWFFRARQELAWTALVAGDAQQALVQSAVLAAPWLAQRYYRPDGPVVEGAALLALCRPNEAAARARAAEAALQPSIARLVTFLRRRAEARLYYTEAAASIANRSRALDPQTVKILLADPSFRRAVLAIGQLQRERGHLYHGDPDLRELLAVELDQRLVWLQQQAGRTVQRLLTATLAELRTLRLRCHEVRFESRRRRGAPGAPLVGPAGSVRRRTAERAARSGTEVLRWPFVGEYWPDEVARLQLVLPPSSSSSCPPR